MGLHRVEVGFTAALAAEGLLEAIDARHDDGRVDLTVDDWPLRCRLDPASLVGPRNR